MKKTFDAFEIHPVKKADPGDSPYDCFDQCKPDDPDIYAWAVYGHRKGKGIECLADCPTKETAELVRSALNIALLGFEELRNAAKLVLIRWTAGDLAEAVRQLDVSLDGLEEITAPRGKELNSR
jgi:hypothetical protein